MKKSLKKSKKPSLTVAYVRNKIVWPLISKFVRLSESNSYGIGHCITCGVAKHWKELQAGHFNPGRWNSIIFEIRGIHSQCYHCNVELKGNPREYDRYMRNKYGDNVVEELDELSKKSFQFDVPTLLSLVADYKPKVEELLKTKI